MLELMNEFAEYVNGTWGREAGIKVHCSTGQVGAPIPFPYRDLYLGPYLGPL
jgi:hypothetical protein